MPAKKNPRALSARDVAVRGTAMAAVITAPSLAAFLIVWTVLDDLITAAVIGGIVHFVAMGFSLRISRRFFTKTPGPDA